MFCCIFLSLHCQVQSHHDRFLSSLLPVIPIDRGDSYINSCWRKHYLFRSNRFTTGTIPLSSFLSFQRIEQAFCFLKVNSRFSFRTFFQSTATASYLKFTTYRSLPISQRSIS